VRSTGEIAFLETDVVQHPLHQRHVLRLTAVRRARNSDLLLVPPQLVEPARGEERNYLEGLRTRSPEGKCVAVAGGAEELISFSDYRGVYSVLRLGPFAAADCNIELIRFDHTSRYSG